MALLDKIKDEVANDNGWDDWHQMEYSDLESWEVAEIRANLINEIATRYAKAVLERAAENVKISVKERVDGTKFIAVIKESILNTKLD